MKTIYADLHVHIGATTRGNPVKITASRGLVFGSIIRECLERKGIDLVGIVDCASPGVLADIKKLIKAGELMELPEGGLLHRDRVTVILGSELETVEENGGVSHMVGFFPFLSQIQEFSNLMSAYVTNMELSSQRASLPAGELYDVIRRCGGIMMPAHVFTPHKSVYGNAADRMTDLLGEVDFETISVVELGLSADTYIADHLAELRNKTFLSNSDAHSLPKIAREYNVLQVEKVNFREMILAFNRSSGRKVIANYGMDPKLGKYHRSFCNNCQAVVDEPPPVLSCPRCGALPPDFVRGV
ncbi:MAG: TIGR00375 family protein, partial [Candidatus Eremiobacteraeota bacterium]|nr:TIGR00375 family protein [Candidatus Eremiobacteraeota bacterium]